MEILLQRNKNQKVFPACVTCIASMRLADCHDSNYWSPSKCLECTNWMLCNLDEPMLQYSQPLNFPGGYILGGSQVTDNSEMLSPMVLTYPILENVIRESHDELASGNWTPMQATS